MKTLYIECSMGAAGDMLTAALLELLPDPDGFAERLNKIGLEGVKFTAVQELKCGITGTRMIVQVDGAEEESTDIHHEHSMQGHDHYAQEHEHHTHEHHAHDHEHQEHEHHHEHHHGHHEHHTLSDIEHTVSQLAIPEEVCRDVIAVYRLIAEAEGHAHARPVEEIRFHEVGTRDAIADITAVCLLIHELAPERVIVSPIHVGCGQVQCAHGILPVPAPATAWILRGVPTYGGAVQGELCTPTGAALLKHFATEFAGQPVMRVEQIGYGCGRKDFPQANVVRVMLGESEKQECKNREQEGKDREQECKEQDCREQESVTELSCNLDDMTPEAIGYAMEQLLEAGALDVFTTPIGMKKNRPGILLTCICRIVQREEMLRLLFLHTTTLGVRESVCRRYTLHRTISERQTAYGSVHVKTASGWGVEREKPEYEDMARIAREQGVSLQDIYFSLYKR